MTAMPSLSPDDLRAIQYWLPRVYLAGTAQEIAPVLQELNALMARIAAITAAQASQNTENLV